MRYDYSHEIQIDAEFYILDHYTDEEIAERIRDRDEFSEELYDAMWIADSVTGNASGSYYCNAYRAEQAIAHNWDLLRDALAEFGCADCNPIEKGAEWCDVTIRCYLLGECIEKALDTLENDIDERVAALEAIDRRACEEAEYDRTH